MPPPIPVRPPIDDADPHRVWEEHMLFDLAERVDNFTERLDRLADKFDAHIRDEGNQYGTVARKLDKLFAQNAEYKAVAVEFQQCRQEFKEHVTETRKDHENARFFVKLAAWGGGALALIATNFNFVLPLLERLFEHAHHGG